MLMPKKVKYRKQQRGRMAGKAWRGSDVSFGDYGLKAMEPCWMTARQIEAARVAMTRFIKRGGKIWVRVFPDKPITKKPQETRMGKGKGAPEQWVCVVRPGRILFEMEGVTATEAREALTLAASKLPILTKFATRAYRRPVDGPTVDRLVKLAESFSAAPGRMFEAGVAQAMTVVLASPRFLFREEGTLPAESGKYPLLDEYALASRLSYFLWSSMPDDELFRLAGEGKLRENLEAQFERMLSDRKSAAFVEQFAGQWLRSRDVPNAIVDARAVMSRQAPLK